MFICIKSLNYWKIEDAIGTPIVEGDPGGCCPMVSKPATGQPVYNLINQKKYKY